MTQHTSREQQAETEHSADVQVKSDGELVTAPWLGLHYRSEAP